MSQGLAFNAVSTILKDDLGNLWFGTEGGGVSKYDGKSFTTYTTQQGLANNDIRAVLKDNKGNLWFGTRGGGVSRYDGKSFTTYSTEQGLANDDVRSILQDKDGNFWFGTQGGGASRFDGKNFINFTNKEGLPDNFINSILEDKENNLWFSTAEGLTRYDGKSFTTYTKQQGLPNDYVYNTIVTKEQYLLAGTNDGIAILTGYVLTENPSRDNNKDQRKLHLPSQNNLSNKELTEHYKPVFEIYSFKTGYPAKDFALATNSIYLDSKGIIWFGSGSKLTGLTRFDYTSLNKNPQATHVYIQQIKIDNENVIWNDLLNKKEENHHPHINQKGHTTPPVVTEEVTTLGKPLSSESKEEMRKKFADIKLDSISKFYPIPQNLELPHTHNNITFDFAAIEPAKPQDVLYQYRLDGYNKDWSPPSNDTRATFTNLFEGNYQFKVKAQSPYGVWSEPITYTFKVLPPWYRTGWAYSLYAISALISIYSVFHWRTAALRKRQKVLEKTVKERTQELTKEKIKSDGLLLNILPAKVAQELKETGSAKTQAFESVTVLFTDFKNFTRLSELLTVEELVAEIDYCFKSFDAIMRKYNIEKIKTIGDSYMAAGGLPVSNQTHAKDVVCAALEIAKFMEKHNEIRKKEGREFFGIRIGINTGPVIAGVVGSEKFAYDIWGDTVNLASRMESSGEEGKVNISGNTYQLVKDDFHCVYRGKIQAKGKGEVDMYFVF